MLEVRDLGIGDVECKGMGFGRAGVEPSGAGFGRRL